MRGMLSEVRGSTPPRGICITYWKITRMLDGFGKKVSARRWLRGLMACTKQNVCDYAVNLFIYNPQNTVHNKINYGNIKMDTVFKVIKPTG